MKTVYFILLSFICLTLCHSSNSHDDLYRLIHAEGSHFHPDSIAYTLDMSYDIMGNPLHKKEDILSGGNLSQESSDILYSYTHDKPNAASWIGNRKMEYDKNGNLEYWTDTLTNGYRRFQWNEDNQLLGVEENGYISRYTYDSQGERIIKAHGGIQGVFINGAPAASIIKAEQITTYISPFMTVTGGRFTKHYYAGTKRIASKIGNGTFNNQYRPGSHNILAGGVNCIERYNQIEQNKKEYIRSLGVPPGPPTMKGIYAEPEYSGQAFPDGGTPQNTAPANWPHKPIQAPPGGPPGPPVQYGPDITNETANGGFGFITTGHIEETDRYFYHSDHLGSSSYITDWKGNVSQFMVYLPFGELLVDRHVTGKSEMPYKFNAKEKDEETGLYYYGARYYNGKDQVWMGVDPAWEKYPGVSGYAYCGNNPILFIDPTGMDWIVAEGTTNYQWRDDITAKSTMPEGYQYVGANNADILTHLGMNYNFPELNTNDIGMVAADAELGKYAVSHLVNVKEKSNATITANVSFNKDNATDNNSLGRTFNGVSINVTDVSSNSGVDGDMMGGGLVSVQYGNKTYQSALKEPEGTYFRQTGTTIGVANVNIPQSDLSVGTKFSQIQVKGNWFVQKPEGRTPVVRHALVPYPLSFKHTWTFK